jgi:uncharacterized RDD family membrane protein YckC
MPSDCRPFGSGVFEAWHDSDMTGEPISRELDEEPAVPVSVGSAGDTHVVGLRGLQFVLDLLIAIVPPLVVAVAVTFAVHSLLSPGHLLLLARVFVMVWFWVAITMIVLVQVWWPHRHGGRTPVMRWCGLRLVTIAGEQPPVSAYVVRWLLMVVDGFVFGLVGLVIMMTSKRQQRFGDMVAGTLVIRDRQRT